MTVAHWVTVILVPVVGLEPTPCRQERILSPSRLPFHHTGISLSACLLYLMFQGNSREIIVEKTKNEQSVKSAGRTKKSYPNEGKRAMMIYVKLCKFI